MRLGRPLWSRLELDLIYTDNTGDVMIFTIFRLGAVKCSYNQGSWVWQNFSHKSISAICDRIWENLAYCHNTHMAKCMLLVPQVKKCQIKFLSYSCNLFTDLCRRLRRVCITYQGEISLHFNLPSLYSCRTWSPLLRVLIRIPAHGHLDIAS